jgi:L-fuconolactonase
MRRRDVLKFGGSIAGGLMAEHVAAALPATLPIIDTHIHLFDPGRPGGVPWPEKTDTALYKPALPDRFASLARPFGVVGAIVIEASPLPSDNDWVLRVAEKYPIIVGMIGDLIPGSPTYQQELDRLHSNPLFLGIRYGNLWDRNLAIDRKKPGFVPGLKVLAERGLTLDSANPNADLIRAIADVANAVPELRIVVDHLPTSPIPTTPEASKEYWALQRTLAQNRNIFVKLSEVLAARVEEHGGAGFAKERLDALWDIFGEDHVLYASDWPNSDHHATYEETFTIVRNYFSTKSRAAQDKFFWKNSITAYRWHARAADQPHQGAGLAR